MMRTTKTVIFTSAWITLSAMSIVPRHLAGQSPTLVSQMSPAETAIWKLRDKGPAAVPQLVSVLDQHDYQTGCTALRVLAEIGDPTAVSVLSKTALSDSPLSDIARRYVAQIGGPDAATCLIAVLQHHVTGDRTAEISNDLAAIGDNRAIEPLIQLLQGQLIKQRLEQGGYAAMEKVRARSAAAKALGRFRDPRARAALNNAIKEDPDWEVYIAAKQALREMDRNTTYWDSEWRSIVRLALDKLPEPPEGAEAFVEQWKRENAGKLTESEPSVRNYAAPAEITRARRQLLDAAKFSPTEVVEVLMTYLQNRKITNDCRFEAMQLILHIGEPGVPALEVGEQRGDESLKKHCRDCIASIRAHPTMQPVK